MAEPTFENLNAHGHEPIETNVRAVWKTGMVIVGVVVASYALIFGMLRWFSATQPPRSPGQAPRTDPDYAEFLPLQQLRFREAEILNDYEWVDEESGLARIPIERAMQIVAEAGFAATVDPSRAETPASNQEANEPDNTDAEEESDAE